MAKITAIHGGGDWHDASADYLVLPDGMDIAAEKAAWDRWYRNEYCPALRVGHRPQFVSFAQWLTQRGAREPGDDEMQIVFDA